MLIDLVYSPFESVKNKEVVMVDGHNVDGLVLSHWKNNRTPEQFKADTSAESVLKLIASGEADDVIRNLKYVTATHFDIDGYVGVAAILNPRFAGDNRELLKRVAELGDFRNFKTDENGIKALKVCCLINGLERKLYEAPFQEYRNGKLYKSVARPKFDYFIPKFTDIINKTEHYQDYYLDEFEKVMTDIELIEKGAVEIKELPEFDLSIIISNQPLHYYASFSYAEHDRVLTIIEPENYIEFEHKYYTWVDIISRETRPRMDMTKAAQELTELEKGDVNWFFTGIEDTAGMLYSTGGSPMEKVKLYQSLDQRPRARSSIPSAEIVDLIKSTIQENEYDY